MFRFLIDLRGNPRACLYTEPLWGIPFNLYAPFFALYMHHLGVLDVQIGIILTISTVSQLIVAPFAGVITDKFGRRHVTLIFDVIAWSIPALLWAASQNFYWFLAAAAVNAFRQVTSVSWECLWVDDIEKEKIGMFFNWLFIAVQLAVFFAPVAGIFVARYGVVPVVRVLFLATFVSMTAKFVLLWFLSAETEVGKKRMEATKGDSIFTALKGYKEVFAQIKSSFGMKRAVVMQTIQTVIVMVSTTFFALYVTQDLGAPEEFMGYFPILRGAIMLSFILFMQKSLARFKARAQLMAGICLYVFSLVWLLLAPPENTAWLIAYVALEAVSVGLLFPRIEAAAASSIDPTERARIRSVYNIVILAISAPFGILAGFLSDMNRMYPFMLNIALLFILAFFALMGNRRSLAGK